MLYPITRPMASLALWANYRKIILTNTDRIPKDKAVILAANHPTAFIEPCILACFLDRPLHFLVRGDFFKKSLYEKLLRNLHMLPVYRMKDGGYRNLKQNFATFASCFEALRERKTIMILAEGRTIHEKRLRPLRKGAARIALGALEAYPDIGEVYIVPVGVNYTYADQPRSEVLIDFGEPILATHFMEAYQNSPNQAIADLTDTLKAGMRERIVVIEDAKDEELTERLLVMHRAERPESRYPVIERASERLLMEITVAETINQLSEEDKARLWSSVDRYFDRLDQAKLEDSAVAEGTGSAASPLSGVWYLLAAPIYLLGHLWSYLPLRLARWIVDKNVRHIEFYEPVRLAVSIGAFLLWALIWIVLATTYLGWLGLLLVLVLAAAAYLAVVLRENYHHWQERRRYARLAAADRDQLRRERAEIMEHFAQLQQRQMESSV